MVIFHEISALVSRHYLRLLLSTAIGIAIVISIATVQFNLVYSDFRPTFLIMPAIVGATLGFSVGLATLLIGLREKQLRQRIEEKDQLVKQLENSEQRFRQLAENINEVFWVYALDTGTIEYVSPAFEKIWQVPCENLYEDSRLWYKSIHPDDKDMIIEQLGFRGRDPDANPVWPEFRIITGQQEVRWIQLRSYPITDNKGGMSALVGVTEDITDHRETRQQMLQATARAEKASLAKSSFLANMSHELRTPLNSIIGFSQVLSGETFGSLGSDKNKEYVEIISSAGGHLLNVIGDILDLTRIETGEDELFEEKIDVSSEIERSMEMMQDQAKRKNIDLHKGARFEDVKLLADEVRVRQIVLNLLSNSIKFTPDYGAVAINLWHGDDGSTAISIEDNGIGIAPENIQKVIRPFEQVEDVFTRQTGGTGLGLSLVRSLAELHGGKMSLVSTLGEGTTVTIHFPAERLL
jgi:PAS domain S-box-containing protein